MEHRYTIEVSDKEISIEGRLSIEEMFDWLNYFDKQGFKSAEMSYNDGSLILHKYTIEEKEKYLKSEEKKEDDIFYEKLYNSEKEANICLRENVKYLEDLIKKLMTEEHQKRFILEEENQKLHKERKIQEMQSDPNVKAILDSTDESEKNL